MTLPNFSEASELLFLRNSFSKWTFFKSLEISEILNPKTLVAFSRLSIALANSGDVQVELIQQRDDTPTMYQDFLGRGLEGLQHWSSWPEDYDALYHQALEAGYEVGQEADTPRGRFVYFWNEGHPGTVIEMAHLSSERRRIFDAIREAAVDWEGAEPIRREWP